MPEINVEADLNAVNEQVVKLVDELNKISAARENLIQQVQNLNGVAMYLRGKMPQPTDGEATSVIPEMVPEELGKDTESFERSAEYPDDKKKASKK